MIDQAFATSDCKTKKAYQARTYRQAGVYQRETRRCADAGRNCSMDLFSDNSATVILSQAYRNFLTALLDSICLKMSVMREEEKDGQKLGRINRVNAEES